MTILRAGGARFASGTDDVALPHAFTLQAAERRTLEFATGRDASIAARLCAAIVKPTHGEIYVADYDTRLQPPQAKRLVGFIDVAGFGGSPHTFACEVAFRAEVWGLAVRAAQIRARETLAVIGDVRDPYARALALALVPDVRLLVFDQPAHPRYSERVAEIAPQAAIVETRVATKAVPLRLPRDFFAVPS